MFTWVGTKLDAILTTYVFAVVSSLISAITPIALTALTTWVALFGWAVIRGEVHGPVNAFVWKTFKIGLVLAFALETSFYISNVSDSASALAMGVAATFLPPDVDPSTITSPFALLDHFNDDASKQIADIMKEASMFRLDLLLAAAVFSIGSVVFLCIALFVVTLSKLFLAFVIGVGPLFVLCLAWRPTHRFFDSWLSMVLNAVVLTWFAFFALGLSALMGDAMFKAISDGGGFLGATFNVLGEATRYCVLMVLMAILCFQAPSLASALTGGAAIQQGVQMIQNVLMVAGLRSVSARTALLGATGGGVIRPGGGVTSLMTRVVGGMSAGAAMTSQRLGAVRTAAYRLAALRGRT